MNTPTDTQQLQADLYQSIQQHERMLDCMQNLEKDVGTASPASLMRYNETLMEFQKNALQIEQVLSIKLASYSGKNESIQSLIDMRQHLLQDILILNERITAKGTGIKSFLAHEVGRLHTGLSAMNGYRQHQDNQGRIVNSAL